VVEIVRDCVSEVFILSAFFLANIVKKDELWKVEGRIFIDVPESEEIDKQAVALTKALATEQELTNISATLIVDNVLKKIFGITSFCFYINSYGKICAFHIVIPNINIPFEMPQYCNEVKEKDLKDYCLKAKDFIEKGTTLRHFDFLPLYGWCEPNDGGVIFAIVISYSISRIFSVPYRINILGDKVDLNMIGEPIEIKK